MAASNLTIEVQEYLDKHKINALFEDMRAKLIKNLPSDPISYLVTVLKGIQERKKRSVSSRGSTTSSRVEVEGKSIKPAATDKLAKSTDNTRPTSTSTPKKLSLKSASVPAVTSRSSSSKLKAPETPTTPKGTVKDPPRPLKDTPRPPKTATPRTSKPTTVSSKPSSATRPSTAPSNGQAKSTRSTRPQPSSSSSKVTTKSTTPRTTASKGSPSKSTPSKSTPSKPASGTAKRILKPTAPAVPAAAATTTTSTTTTSTTVKAPEETIDEFFGEKKKSSSKQMFVSKQEEVTELEGVKEKPSVDEEADTEMISAKEAPSEDTTLIDAYLEKKKGQSKSTRDDHLKNLQDMILTDQKSADSGNHDNDEESDKGEETVTLLEDIQVLQEEEGVDAVKSQDSHTKPVTKKQVTAANQEMICARCARTITVGDMVATTADDDFESASQITSQGNLPSWDASTTVTEQSSGDSERPSNYDDNDSTVVSVATTAASKDEWAGLTQAQPPVISDSESEVQLPKVPLTGKGWTPPPTQQESQITSQGNLPSWDASTTVTEQSSGDSERPSNYDDNDSTVVSVATTAASKDEWAGLTQAQPPVISDSESEVQLPKVPLTGKGWTPPPTQQESDEPSTAQESDEPSTAQEWAT